VTNRDHLHHDDCPDALAILAAVAGGRTLPGVEPTDVGAFVDWDRLASSWLSSTERAAAIIARGVAQAERHGGLPPRVAAVVANVAVRLSPPFDRHRSVGAADPASPNIGIDR
jgi:hypothetical protein